MAAPETPAASERISRAADATQLMSHLSAQHGPDSGDSSPLRSESLPWTLKKGGEAINCGKPQPVNLSLIYLKNRN